MKNYLKHEAVLCAAMFVSGAPAAALEEVFRNPPDSAAVEKLNAQGCA